MSNSGIVKGLGTGHLKLDNKRIQRVAGPLTERDVTPKGYTDQAAASRPDYSYPTVYPGKPNSYSAERGVYNFKAANTRILDQGLSNVMAGGIDEQLWIGDSLMAGAVSNQGVQLFDRLRAVPLAFRDQLAMVGTPANGTGIVRMVDSANVDSRVVFTGAGWANNVSYASCTTNGSSVTVTIDRPGTICDVWYYDSSGAVATVSINGATTGNAFATITTANTAVWKKRRLSGVSISPGATVKVTVTTAGVSGFIISGVSVWSPTGGLVVHNAAQTGSRATNTGVAGGSWTNATSSGPAVVFKDVAGKARTVTDATSTLGSPTLGSATAAFTTDDVGTSIFEVPDSNGLMFPPGSYISAYVSATQVTMSANAITTGTAQTVRIGRDPSCVHIGLGVNDLVAGATVPSIISSITTIRNSYPNSDCILHTPPDILTSFVSATQQAEYLRALYTLADTLNVPLFDWRDRTGDYAGALSRGVYGDINVHLSAATYADIGASLAVVIGGGSAQPQSIIAPRFEHDLTNKKYVDDLTGRRARVTNATVATTTTEGIAVQVKIPANTFKVGSTIKYKLVMRPSATSITTVRVRIGAAGTTADAAVVVMSATGLTNANTRTAEGDSMVLAIGTAATHLGAGTENVGGASIAGSASATSGTFDSTKDNWVSVTVQNTSSATTTAYVGWIEVNI